MRTVFRLWWADWRLFVREPLYFSLTFLVPVVLIFIFGAVFGRPSGDRPPLRLAVLIEDRGPLARAFATALSSKPEFRLVRGVTGPDGNEVPFTPETLRAYVQSGRVRVALWLPPAPADDNPFRLQGKLLLDPRNEMETGLTEGLLQQTAFQQIPEVLQSLRLDPGTGPTTDRFLSGVADLVAREFGVDLEVARAQVGAGGSAGDPGAGPAAGFTDLVRFEREQVVGAEVRSPMAARSVGGWSLMFLLYSITGVASGLFALRESGVIDRLLSGPVTRDQLLWSKYLFNASVGVAQLAVLFTIGHLLFDLELERHAPALLVVCVAAAAACSAFGMLLAAFLPSAGAVNGLGSLLILSMSAVGGAWFPTSMMPDFIQILSRFTVVYWAQEGFLAILWAQTGLTGAAPAIGVLLAIAAAVTALGIWRFRRSPLFT